MVGVSMWGEDSRPPGKLPACGAEWLSLTPVTLPPAFSSVLLYWTIHSLTLYLHCLQHRSSVLWWFLASKFLWVEITAREHKWKESSKFQNLWMQLCYLTAVWPWKISQTLRRWIWQPPPVFFLENPMDRGAWWATVHGSQELDLSEPT